MQLSLKDGLPFVSLVLIHGGGSVRVNDVLIDTGSASTILAARVAELVGIEPQLDDTLYMIRGVGGVEAVYSRQVSALSIGRATLRDVEVEIGGMNYGFPIDGILGMDLLTQAGAIIDLRSMNLDFTE